MSSVKGLHLAAIGPLLFGFALGAVAAERTFTPVESEGQQVRFDDGEAYISANGAGASVFISYRPRDRKSAFVTVGVRNDRDTPFNLSEHSVTAQSNGSPLVVMTYAERMKELKRSEMWAGIGAGLAAAGNNMNAQQAGRTSTYGTYSGTTNARVHGSSGSAYGTANTYGTYSGTTYDSGAAFQAQQQANAENQALFDRQRANAEFARQDVSSRALKANTIDPGEFVMGDVRFTLPRKHRSEPVEFWINVEVAGETLKFLFREQK